MCKTGGTSLATPTMAPTPSPTTVSSAAFTTNSAAARPIRESSPSTRRVNYLRSFLHEQGLSKGAQDQYLWLSSWRSSTNAAYVSAWRQFDHWCGEREIDCFWRHQCRKQLFERQICSTKSLLHPECLPVCHIDGSASIRWSANQTAPGCLPCYARCEPHLSFMHSSATASPGMFLQS